MATTSSTRQPISHVALKRDWSYEIETVVDMCIISCKSVFREGTTTSPKSIQIVKGRGERLRSIFRIPPFGYELRVSATRLR